MKMCYIGLVTTLIGDCLLIGNPSWYIANQQANSAFHPSGVGKPGLPGCGQGLARLSMSVAVSDILVFEKDLVLVFI